MGLLVQESSILPSCYYLCTHEINSQRFSGYHIFLSLFYVFIILEDERLNMFHKLN